MRGVCAKDVDGRKESRWPKMGRTKRDMRERFMEKVAKVPSGCWEWQAAFFVNGYGSFGIDNRPHYAHRISWHLHYGFFPVRPQMICHTCDNRKCVNPAHLYLGDNSTNQRDRFTRGAAKDSPRRRLVDGKYQWIPGSALPQKRNVR